VETLARKERRTKSELFREMVRVYRRYAVERERDEDRWMERVIAETKAEEARNPTSTAELLAESERLVKYGGERSKKLGIRQKDVVRIIHENRKERRASHTEVSHFDFGGRPSRGGIRCSRRERSSRRRRECCAESSDGRTRNWSTT
jgi:hypothetical protein